ncbi:MAG: hypothetical protein LC808_04775 [Actinobacteria bacterium]|nr:hypothetical protein [Actinomycetota bacterium]
MRKKLALVLAGASLATTLLVAAPTPAQACADPKCPWSPVTSYVYDQLYWVKYNCNHTIGDTVDGVCSTLP